MSESILSEVDDLKVIYKEIIEGFFFDDERNIYIKHLSDLETNSLSQIKSSLFKKFKKDGIFTESERLKQIIDSEEWSAQKDDDIISLRFLISDNQKNLAKIIPQQHPPILKIIEQKKQELSSLLLERKLMMGATAEDFAERELVYKFIGSSFFLDEKLTIRMFPDGLDELENKEIEPYINLLDSTIKRYNELNIQKIASLPFFLNPFSYSKDSVYTFIQRPISQLTSYQLMLFSLGSRNLNILSQVDGEPPELIGDTKTEDVVKWFDMQFSILLGKKKGSK